MRLMLLPLLLLARHGRPRRPLAAGACRPKVIAWRRDIHQHPELGNRESRTSKLVADHLRKLGLEVRTGIAHTGVCRRPARRQARSAHRPARRHGRAATHGAGGAALRVEGDRQYKGQTRA
jgi:hypothetical protein